MLKIGITGGIGSGKSYVCKLFATMGIPVFDADANAKWVMENNLSLRNELILTFGNECFKENKINRPYLANIVFNNAEKLQRLNDLVHPHTFNAYKTWANNQTSPYIIKEAALMFETEAHTLNHINVLVTAPTELKISRVIERDKTNTEAILARMAKQMTDEEKRKLTTYYILNDGLEPLLPQIYALHTLFIEKARTTK